MSTKLVCAWCQSRLDTADNTLPDADASDLDEISHGICPACYNNQIKEIPATGSIQ